MQANGGRRARWRRRVLALVCPSAPATPTTGPAARAAEAPTLNLWTRQRRRHGDVRSRGGSATAAGMGIAAAPAIAAATATVAVRLRGGYGIAAATAGAAATGAAATAGRRLLRLLSALLFVRLLLCSPGVLLGAGVLLRPVPLPQRWRLGARGEPEHRQDARRPREVLETLPTPLPSPAPLPSEDATYPYDGGPRVPLPMPRAEPVPAPEVAPPSAPVDGHSVSLPLKVAGRLTYPATAKS